MSHEVDIRYTMMPLFESSGSSEEASQNVRTLYQLLENGDIGTYITFLKAITQSATTDKANPYTLEQLQEMADSAAHDVQSR